MEIELDRERRRRTVHVEFDQKYPLYLYQRLLSSRSFRLLRLLGHDKVSQTIYPVLKPCSIDKCDPYIALSYTRGLAADRVQNHRDPGHFSSSCSLVILEQPDYDELILGFIKTPELPN